MTDERIGLTPYQMRAVDKLRKLRVGAVYSEIPGGNARIALELARLRIASGKVAGAIWLCAYRRRAKVRGELERFAGQWTEAIWVRGIESFSHSALALKELAERAREEPVMLIVDDSTLVKNPSALRTLRTIALSELCPYRLILSEVPFTRDIADLYAQWRVLDWRILGYRTYWSFSANHMDSNRHGRNVGRLVAAMEPYLFQALLSEMMLDGPNRREYLWRFPLGSAALQCYRQVIERFLLAARYTRSGVYRLLHAAQHVVCGRVVERDFPLQTRPMYETPWRNPRIRALLQVLRHYPRERILILFKYEHERNDILRVLGEACADLGGRRAPAGRRLLLQNQLSFSKNMHHGANVLIYYSHHWDWAKRRDKEEAPSARTVINLVAANTIDEQIVRCIWKKESLVDVLRAQIAQGERKWLYGEGENIGQSISGEGCAHGGEGTPGVDLCAF